LALSYVFVACVVGVREMEASSHPSLPPSLPPSLSPSLPPSLPPSDHFHSYDFVHVWGGTVEEANEKVMAFFESSHFKVGREGGREGGRMCGVEGGREGKMDKWLTHQHHHYWPYATGRIVFSIQSREGGREGLREGGMKERKRNK